MNSNHHSFNSRTFLTPPKRFLVPLNYAHIVSGINPLASTVSNDRRRQWHPTPVLLPGKSHGWRSLVGFGPWDCWVRHDWATSLSLFTFMHWRRKWQPTPVFLPGESRGMGEPGGLPSMGSQRVGHDWSDLAAAAAVRYDGIYDIDFDIEELLG